MLLNCFVGEDSRIPWTARRSHHLIVKEIRPEYSLEGLMLKLKLQHFGHLMWRTDSMEKSMMLGKTERRIIRGDRGWGVWMTSPTQWTWVWARSGSWWWTGKPGVLQSMELQRVRLNWTESSHLYTGCAIHIKWILKATEGNISPINTFLELLKLIPQIINIFISF